MSTEIAKIDPKQFGLEESKAQEMTSGLSVTLDERKALIDQYNQVINLEITEANLPIFKDLRIKIRDNRTKGILKWHETNKEFYLRGGQFVDAIKKREIVINEAMEEKLAGAEKHFENLEKEKMANLQKERMELLRPFDVENLEKLELGSMEASVFDSFLFGCQSKFEKKKEAEAKAEAERIESERVKKLYFDRLNEVSKYSDYSTNIVDFHMCEWGSISEEKYTEIKNKLISAKEDSDKLKEEQRLENERLKKEAEEMEKELEAEKKRAEEKAKADKEKADKILADQKAKADAILEAERKEKARIEKELQDKKDAEAKEEQAKKDAEEKAKKDAEKLAKQSLQEQRQAWINQFSAPSTELNDTKTEEIKTRFAGFITWANQINNQ